MPLVKFVALGVALIAMGVAPSVSSDTHSMGPASEHSNVAKALDTPVFYIYQDANSEANHGYASGWYNGDANMEYDGASGERPYEGGTCIRVSWNGQAGVDAAPWNGIVFQVHEGVWQGPGMDLAGATRLTFAARTDTPGVSIKVTVGYPTDSCGEITAWVQLTEDWQVFAVPLSGRDLSNIGGLFGFVFDAAHTSDPRSGATFYLDTIAYDHSRSDEGSILGGAQPVVVEAKGPPKWEYQSFGDFAYRTTNFFEDEFDSMAGWADNRLMYGSAVVAQQHRVRPYLKLTWAASGRDYEWANNIVYGVGAEVRPWAHPYSAYARESLSRELLSSTRFYIEWLGIDYTRTEVSGAESDLRIGMDVWREWNVDPIRWGDDLTFADNWSEFYANLAWYDTRFTWYDPDYNAVGFDSTAWLGLRWPKLGRNVYLMPYLRPELSWTPRHEDFFWQNRASLGAGVRLMPFQGSSSEWLNKTKLYVEHVRVLDYLGDSATADTPESDWRFGIAYQLNRY